MLPEFLRSCRRVAISVTSLVSATRVLARNNVCSGSSKQRLEPAREEENTRVNRVKINLGFASVVNGPRGTGLRSLGDGVAHLKELYTCANGAD